MSFLAHHGIKGQHWGVKHGPPYPLDRQTKAKTPQQKVRNAAKTRDKVEDIISTLNIKEKVLLGMDENDPEYLSIEQGEYLAHRVLKEIGGIPVSFFDMLDDGDSINVALATRSGDEYRSKGYALETAKAALDFCENHPEIVGDRPIVWGVKKDNVGSRKIAEKLGFELEPGSDENGWINYVKKPANQNKFQSTVNDVVKKSTNSYTEFKKKSFDEEDVLAGAKLSKSDLNKAKNLANQIYDKASKVEPKITEDVVSAANKSGSKMYGLEYRKKQPTSIARKIGTDAKEKGMSLDQAASSLKDAVRYTTITNDSEFVSSYFALKGLLKSKGYTETRCRNYWDMFNKGQAKHKSVQCVFKDKQGNTFEVQFQTPASQAAKELKIPIYEERRKTGNSSARNAELEKQMEDLAKQVPTPSDVLKIKSHG